MRRPGLVLPVFWLLLGLGPSVPWAEAQTGQARVQPPDTGVYARTPPELKPYHLFETPYKAFFLTELEYPGYGRHLPEPEHVEVVKIGFLGPIIGSVSESIGGPREVVLRVNERQTRWDGYNASHLAPIGIKMLQGARLAVAQANAQGGYRGATPYQLVVRNDNGSWRSSGREVIDLAWKDSVWAILGTVDGANTHIAIRAALKAEIPIMNTADTDPTLVETNIPWVFRNITDDRQMGYLLAAFAFQKLGLERVAVLRAVNRYGRVNIDEFRDAATRLGHPLAAELSYEEGDTLFTDQLEEIRALDPQAVLTYGNSRESALILKQMRAMGMEQWFLGSDRMVTREFIEIVGPGAGRVAAGYPYDPETDDPRRIQFVEDFTDAYGEPPETYAAHAYDGMMMLIQAIERGGLNRALIRDELAAMKTYAGVTGLQEYDAVFSDRSPPVLAVLESGAWAFYTEEEVLSAASPGVLDTPVQFSGWRGPTLPDDALEEVRIGLFAPDSGEVPRGARLAVDELNEAGGFRGTPFRIIQRWAEDPWSGGAKEMVRLAYEDGVWAVLGSESGEATHVAEQVATKAWVPLIAPVSADPTLTYIRIPWIFRLPPDDEAQAEALLRHGILARSLEKVGLITSTDHDGRTFANATLRRLGKAGAPPAFHFEISPSGDLSPIASRARSFGPEALILRVPPIMMNELLVRLSCVGMTVPLLLPWIPGLDPSDLSSLYPGSLLLAWPFHERENPGFDAFDRAYRERYGSPPTPSAAYGFDAVKLLARALEVSGLNRPALRDAIAAKDGFMGATGAISWDNGGGNSVQPGLRVLPGAAAGEAGCPARPHAEPGSPVPRS